MDKELFGAVKPQDEDGDGEIFDVIESFENNPAPLVGVSTAAFVDRKREGLTKVHTVRVIGYHVYETFSEDNAKSILEEQKGLRDKFTNNKEYKIQIKDKGGSVVSTFSNCRLLDIVFEEGAYTHYGKFVASFESTQLDTDNIIDLNYSLDMSQDYSMGYVDTNGAIVSDSYYTCSESITATGLNVDDVIKSIKDDHMLSDGDTVKAAGDGRVFNVRKLQGSRNNVVVTGAEVTVEQTMILIPSALKQDLVCGLSVEISRSYNSGPAVITISGTALSCDEDTTPYESFKDFEDNIFFYARDFEGLLDSEYVRDVRGGGGLSNTDRNKKGSEISRDIGIDNQTGAITFSYQYEVTKSYFVSNAVYERISEDIQRSTPTFAIVPVLGKTNGPVLQSTYSRTENQKTVNIEVVFAEGYDNITEKASVDNVIASYIPEGNVAVVGDVQESYNPSERKYTLSMSWIYTDPIFNLIERKFDEDGGLVKIKLNQEMMTAAEYNRRYQFVEWKMDEDENDAFGGYDNEKFTVSGGGIEQAILSSLGELNFETRDSYVCRVKAVGNIKPLPSFGSPPEQKNFHMTIRVFPDDKNEDAEDPETVILLSNKTMYTPAPKNMIVGILSYNGEPDERHGKTRSVDREVKFEGSGSIFKVVGNKLMTSEKYEGEAGEKSATIEAKINGSTYSKTFTITVL